MEFLDHLLKLRKAFAEQNIPELKRLSEWFAGEVFVHYKQENVDLSVVAYSCSKFLEKPYVVSNPAWASFRKNLLSLLDESISNLNSGKQEKAMENVRKSLSLIEELSDRLGLRLT